jgi:hypothetical protein
MEGPFIRLLMQHGVEVFKRIAVHIKEGLEKTGRAEGEGCVAKDKEIEDFFEAYGHMATLLVSVFSKFHGKSGDVTDELLEALEEELGMARKLCGDMNMSKTPMWHILLDHAPQSLGKIRGFVDMLEDAIE